MASRPPRSAVPDEAPASVPQMPPTGIGYGHGDHSFTLQAVMELQKSVGEMNSTLGTLKSSVDGVKTKVDDLVSWKNRILGGAFVLGAVFSIGAFLIGKFWDYFSIKAPPAISAPAAPQPAIQPPVSLPAAK